jgi:FAD-dependent urate hydroxylase
MQTISEVEVFPSGGLVELERQLRRDLELTDYPSRDWIECGDKSDAAELDVLIIGGGQSGVAVAFGLMRERIHNILVIDENPESFEGPWRTFARMLTLRTPKYLTGPDYGIPNLTFRAWYEAQWGPKSWQELRFVPKEMWADYLLWYRKFLKIPVRNKTRAGAIVWDAQRERFVVPVASAEGESTLYPRKIVLATGIDGSGRWETPAIVSKNLPPAFYAHTHDDIDFNKLKGKRIAVLGAGASAFDNASVALEQGAKEVHLFFRRKKLPNVNPYRWAEFVGFLNHHADLPDAQKWRFVSKLIRIGQLPPADTYERATTFSSFRIHPDSEWHSVVYDGREIKITTARETFTVDFVIVATGFITDLSLRPELKNLHEKVALWQDRYQAPPAEQNEDLARHPYLTTNFEMQEKEPGTAPYLKSIFNYSFGCLLSVGFGGASISGMKYSLRKVVSGITKQLYVDKCAEFYESLENYNIEEF